MSIPRNDVEFSPPAEFLSRLVTVLSLKNCGKDDESILFAYNGGTVADAEIRYFETEISFARTMTNKNIKDCKLQNLPVICSLCVCKDTRWKISRSSQCAKNTSEKKSWGFNLKSFFPCLFTFTRSFLILLIP